MAVPLGPVTAWPTLIFRPRNSTPLRVEMAASAASSSSNSTNLLFCFVCFDFLWDVREGDKG